MHSGSIGKRRKEDATDVSRRAQMDVMASSVSAAPRTHATESVRRDASQAKCALSPSLCAYLNHRIAACRLVHTLPTKTGNARTDARRTECGTVKASASATKRRTDLPPDVERAVYFVDAPDVDPASGVFRWWRYQGP